MYDNLLGVTSGTAVYLGKIRVGKCVLICGVRIFRQIINFSFIGKSKKKPSLCSGFNRYSVSEYIANQRELVGG